MNVNNSIIKQIQTPIIMVIIAIVIIRISVT